MHGQCRNARCGFNRHRQTDEAIQCCLLGDRMGFQGKISAVQA
jgi:hypothetical protein